MNFTPKKGCTYRVINAEFFAFVNKLFVHLAVKDENGIVSREYVGVDKPTYDFYIHDSYDQVFQRDINDGLTKHSCEYNKRFNYISKVLGYNNDSLFSSDYELKKKARNELMSSQRLYRADDAIESVYLNKMVKKLEKLGIYDDTITGKTVFFDIETSFDRNAEDFNKIKSIIENDSQQQFVVETESNASAKFFIELANKNDAVMQYCSRDIIDPQLHRLAIEYARMCTEEEYVIIQNYMKRTIEEYQKFLGVVSQHDAEFRIETITTYSPVDNLLIHDYLIKPESIDPEFGQNMFNPEFIVNFEKQYTDYLRVSMFKFDINQLGKIDVLNIKNDMGEHFLDDFKQKVEDYGTESEAEKQKIIWQDIWTNYIENKLDKYATYPTFEYKVKVHSNELSLILSGLKLIREEFKPSYLAAHNNSFDLFYIKNRLIKYNINPADQWCQYSHFDTDEAGVDMDYIYREDTFADTRKASKSTFTGLGLVMIDTMLLNAKAQFREVANGLDAILKEDFNESKFKYGVRTFEQLYSKHDHFIKYACLDTLLLEKLVKFKNLIAAKQAALDGVVPWTKYSNASDITAYTLKKFFMDDKNLVMQNNPNGYLIDNYKLTSEYIAGAYVTSTSIAESEGVTHWAATTDASSKSSSPYTVMCMENIVNC